MGIFWRGAADSTFAITEHRHFLFSHGQKCEISFAADDFRCCVMVPGLESVAYVFEVTLRPHITPGSSSLAPPDFHHLSFIVFAPPDCTGVCPWTLSHVSVHVCSSACLCLSGCQLRFAPHSRMAPMNTNAKVNLRWEEEEELQRESESERKRKRERHRETGDKRGAGGEEVTVIFTNSWLEGRLVHCHLYSSFLLGCLSSILWCYSLISVTRQKPVLWRSLKVKTGNNKVAGLLEVECQLVKISTFSNNANNCGAPTASWRSMILITNMNFFFFENQIK